MRTAWAMDSLLALAGCDSGSACTFNSECPAGEHCSDGACIAACSDAVPCPAGQACTSFGMCVATDVDAGVDAGTDAGRATDGGTDAGTDAGPPEEVCTPSTAGGTPLDEDGDGAIDEGCPWHFGVPHPVVPAHSGTGGVILGSITPDGLALWLTAARADGTRGVFIAERTATDAPFANARDVTTALGVTAPRITGVWLSPDGLELIYDDDFRTDAPSDLYRVTRTSTTVPFGAATAIAELVLPGARDYAPKLTADGLEIFFTRLEGGVRSLWHARRASPGASFGAPAPIVMSGTRDEDSVGVPSADGLTLFFARQLAGTWTIHRAQRPDRDALAYGEPEPIAALTAPPYSAVTALSEQTREVFITSDRPWTPAGLGVWRAEVCRDGPCPTRELACPAPGVRSPDGLRCYTPGEAETTSWESARTACLARSTAAMSSHLATLHSRAEHDVVWGLRTASQAVWIGMYDREGPGPSSGLPAIPECGPRAGASSISCVFAWATGEPWTYAPWGLCCGGAGDPSGPGQDCGVLWDGFSVPGDFGDYPCSGPGVPPTPYVCEDELWPTW